MARRVICGPWLALTTATLVCGGWFMVGSASNYVALEFGRSPSAYGWRHAVHLLLGCVALFACYSLPYQRLAARRVVRGSLIVCFALLLVVLITPPVGGARRWLPLGFFNLQPSEFAKLAAVLYVARLLSRKQERVNDLRAVLLPCLAVIGGIAYLVNIEPDLGSAVIPVVVAAAMLFVAGLRWSYVAAAGALAAVAGAVAVAVKSYRLDRVAAFLDPWSDPLDKGYQLCQSLIAFGNGGIAGMGMGGGQQRALFLPAPHTDFIYSVVGEDFGLIGCVVLLAAFVILFWRGLVAALGAPDRFGFYLALGLTCLLALQGLINMCVCVGLLPTKGLPLPFISYGGSSLVASMAAMGLLLKVSIHAN
jgi:cell division protein FtsW